MRGPLLGALAVLLFLSPGAAGLHRRVGAQVVEGRTRPAKTGTLMKILFKPCGDRLEQALKGVPGGEGAWEHIFEQAVVLNELSYAFMDDGRCPDKRWADACAKLREGSFAVMTATDRKDVKAARAGLALVKASCGACHQAWKR